MKIIVKWIIGLNLVGYSDHHLNTGHLNTGQVKVHFLDVFIIQIPTICHTPDPCVLYLNGILPGIQMPFEYWTIHQKTFQHFNTRPVWYIFKCPLYKLFLIKMIFYTSQVLPVWCEKPGRSVHTWRVGFPKNKKLKNY